MRLRKCHDCGLTQQIPASGRPVAFECVRCGARLERGQRGAIPLAFSLSALGLSLLSLGLGLPMATVSMDGGRFATSSVLTGPALLSENGALGLGIVAITTLLLLPALQFGVVVLSCTGIWLQRTPIWMRRAFARVETLIEWSMMDVFLLGATISLVRLGAWMQVDVQPAMIAWAGAAICSFALARTLDPSAFWDSMTPASMREETAFAYCHHCHGQQPQARRCRRCGSALHERKVDSVNRSWALVAAALVLAIPANVLPVMTIQKSGSGGAHTILGGTVELATNGFVGLAVLVFVASILVPLLKLGVLCVALLRVRRPRSGGLQRWTRLYRFVSVIGRWSMLDIFATMILVAMARFGWVGSVVPEAGATAFCAVVLLTMLAVEAFDPRLMWDAAGLNGPQLARNTVNRPEARA